MHHLGLTRSVSRREYLLQTPDTFVRTPLPGLSGGWAVVHAAPLLGARFAMTTIELEPGGFLGDGPAQRFVYVLEGEVSLGTPDGAKGELFRSGSFAYLPAGAAQTIAARQTARIAVIEKSYQALPGRSAELGGAAPQRIVGHEDRQASTALNGDADVQVRCLLPASPIFDFAVNTMTYAPGASLSQVEVHYMEHGLLMLGGGGIYRLGEDWHPVAAGDFLWMAPGCPQWFAAVGKTPARYLIYKDFNRHVLA